MVIILTIHIPSSADRATNALMVQRGGEVIARYDKLHLYDAFSIHESRLVDAGKILPSLIEVEGIQVGLITRASPDWPCYLYYRTLSSGSYPPPGCKIRSRNFTGRHYSLRVRWTPPAICLDREQVVPATLNKVGKSFYSM